MFWAKTSKRVSNFTQLLDFQGQRNGEDKDELGIEEWLADKQLLMCCAMSNLTVDFSFMASVKGDVERMNECEK